MSDQSTLALIGALSAIGGALATFFPLFWHSKIKEKELKRSVTAQFYAEIKATLVIERSRGYINDIINVVDTFKNNPTKTHHYYVVQVSENRFPIFKANVQNIGILNPKIQTKIVLFYQLIEAVIQDMKPGGLINQGSGGNQKAFQELLSIMHLAKSTAEEIMSEIESEYTDL